MRDLVKRKLKGTASSENYVLAGSAETIEEDHAGSTESSHAICYEKVVSS